MPVRHLIAIVLAALPLLADEVELKNGAAFSGKIVAEDETSITVRLDQGGTLCFEKSRVAKIHRGELDQEAGPLPGGTKTIEGPAGSRLETPKPPASDVEQGPLEDLVARVGPGGVTRQEFQVYLLIFARDQGREASTLDDKRLALEPAILDEMIFQASLAEGALEEEYVRWSVTSVYKSNETTAKVDPREFTDQELQAYYDAHPEEFTEPAAVRLEGKRIDSEEEEAEILDAMERGETPAGGFSDQGWLELETPGPISEDDRGILLALLVGEVSPVLEIFGGMRIVYRCAERREARKKSFEESRGRAKFLLLGEKVGDKSEDLDTRLEKEDPDGSAQDRLYREALKKGVHRRPECRPYIINWYLERRKLKKGEAASELRERFEVNVLLKD